MLMLLNTTNIIAQRNKIISAWSDGEKLLPVNFLFSEGQVLSDYLLQQIRKDRFGDQCRHLNANGIC